LGNHLVLTPLSWAFDRRRPGRATVDCAFNSPDGAPLAISHHESPRPETDPAGPSTGDTMSADLHGSTQTDPLCIEDNPSRAWAHFVDAVQNGDGRVIAELVGDILSHDEPVAAEIGDVPGGLRLASWEVVELLNETSSARATATQLADEYAEIETSVGELLGSEAANLLRYFAVEANQYFLYPDGSWPTEPCGWVSSNCDAMTAWCRASRSEPVLALVLAAQITHITLAIGAHRGAQAALAEARSPDA
jgi:hypothetical protein